jgi:hypothetical protein
LSSVGISNCRPSEGELTVDNRQKRLVELSGHLIQAVKFGGGLLGYLDKGGKFNVKQEQVSPGFWEMTVLDVQMKGKALFFKTIAVQQKMLRSGFRRVSDDLTLAQAADILRESPSRATMQSGWLIQSTGSAPPSLRSTSTPSGLTVPYTTP